jgi:antitoxin (DNA-binding transcriptional repressor) of toxin-antitoxin stability system
MKVTATDLANDSKAILDKVLKNGEKAEVQHHGKTIAEIEPAVGATREEMIELLNSIKLTKKESQELKKAMDAAGDVVGYAGRD